ncbi:hypothetical protein Tco_1147168 [Tanacetum coccineum]
MGNGDDYKLEEREILLEKVSHEFLDELKLMGSFGMPIIVDYTRIKETNNELLRWCCKNNIENDYHVDQVRNYIKSQVVWRRENEILENPFPQSEAPIFYGPSNNPNLTITKNKKHTLSLHNIHATTFIDLEEITTRWIHTLIEDMYYSRCRGKIDHVNVGFRTKNKTPSKLGVGELRNSRDRPEGTRLDQRRAP